MLFLVEIAEVVERQHVVLLRFGEPQLLEFRELVRVLRREVMRLRAILIDVEQLPRLCDFEPGGRPAVVRSSRSSCARPRIPRKSSREIGMARTGGVASGRLANIRLPNNVVPRPDFSGDFPSGESRD